MKMRLQGFVIAAVVLASAFIMAACQPAASTKPPTEAVAATEVAAQPATETPAPAMTEAPAAVMTLAPAGTTTAQTAVAKDITLDPALAQDADSQAVAGYVFEPLVGLDKGAAVAWLARKWTVAEDGLAYTFELSPNLKFSDGTPLDSDVVVANFNRWFDPSDSMRGSGDYKAFASVFGGFRNETGADGKPKSALDGVEKTDSLTVILHLNRPLPDLLEKLAGVNFSIAHQADGGSYVGTGAYAAYEKNDQHLLLVPNPYYTGPYAATDNLEFPFK